MEKARTINKKEVKKMNKIKNNKNRINRIVTMISTKPIRLKIRKRTFGMI